MHNHNDKNNSSMMWMTLLCLLILALVLFTGGVGSSSWVFWIAIGAMVVGHLWMMFRGHGSGGEDDASSKEHNASEVYNAAEPASQGKKGHSSHSCCH